MRARRENVTLTRTTVWRKRDYVFNEGTCKGYTVMLDEVRESLIKLRQRLTEMRGYL